MVATYREAALASDGEKPREETRSGETQWRGTGRRRIPMERIERLQARRICFSKRRQGLFRKCMELCRLFPGYEIAAVAFSPDVGTPFDFAGPSSSASPAELFRRFLSERMPSPALGPLADPEEGAALVSADGSVTGASDVVSSYPSSSLDDVQMQTLMDEEETTELEAALFWADSILQVGDEAVDLVAGCCGVDVRPPTQSKPRFGV